MNKMNEKETVAKLLAEHTVKHVFFAACGGSIAAMYPAKYMLEKESKTLTIHWQNAREFCTAHSAALGKDSVVIVTSQQGNTPETVDAARVAKEAGAAVIAFSYAEQPPLFEYADYCLDYSYGPDLIPSQKKECRVVRLSMELLHQLEGWDKYDDAMESFAMYDAMIEKAKEKCLPEAERFAAGCKDEKLIYTLASGSVWSSAYIETHCILMEMQWKNSACIHCGEFFHGPLEITDKDACFLLMMGTGATRVMDERMAAFLPRYAEKIYTIDTEALGILELRESVREFFAPLLATAICGVFNTHLEAATGHSMKLRRYMWKVQY